MEIYIYFIIIGLVNWRSYFYSLVSITETLANFNIICCGSISVALKKNGISEPTIQALLESIDPKTLSQYSGVWKRFYNWINVSKNASEINKPLICEFLYVRPVFFQPVFVQLFSSNPIRLG